jgi:hypothetical protein
VRPAIGCPPQELHHWRCSSYGLIESKPFMVIIGALVGMWLAYALVRLYSAGHLPNFTIAEVLVATPLVLGITGWIAAIYPNTAWPWGNLRWVLLFVLAAVLARLAVGVASIARVRGGLMLAFGLPVLCAGLGYGFITVFRPPAVGHSCPPGATSACVYHPLIGESGPWIVLGVLAGTWLAYAVAVDLAGPLRLARIWMECAAVLPVMTAVIGWALVVGPQQGGDGYVSRFILAVVLTAMLRLMLAAPTVRRHMPGLLTTIGMVNTTGATA